ncbi:MAG: DUF59 domain-containing protein [Gemmatimonadetes bacterium]|nr:DUF59 domain-containing protein [Gemmatimonadota bacterium]
MEKISEEEIKTVLRSVKDPELDLNIIDLGLVYDVENKDGDVAVKMTLTSPGCPAGPEIVGDVERSISALDGIKSVDVEIVWEPYWTPERIDPRVREFLGF